MPGLRFICERTSVVAGAGRLHLRNEVVPGRVIGEDSRHVQPRVRLDVSFGRHIDEDRFAPRATARNRAPSEVLDQVKIDRFDDEPTYHWYLRADCPLPLGVEQDNCLLHRRPLTPCLPVSYVMPRTVVANTCLEPGRSLLPAANAITAPSSIILGDSCAESRTVGSG